MGNPTGFLEINRDDRSYAPVEERVKHYQEFVIPLPSNEVSAQGALHGLRHSVLPPRVPRQQHHPGVERSCIPGQVASGSRSPAFDKQFSGIYRPDLPGAR